VIIVAGTAEEEARALSTIGDLDNARMLAGGLGSLFVDLRTE